MKRTLPLILLTISLMVIASLTIGQGGDEEETETKAPAPFRTTKQDLRAKADTIKRQTTVVAWAEKGATATLPNGTIIPLEEQIGETLTDLGEVVLAGPAELLFRGAVAIFVGPDDRVKLTKLEGGAILAIVVAGTMNLRNPGVRLKTEAPGEVTIGPDGRFSKLKGTTEVDDTGSSGVTPEDAGGGSGGAIPVARYAILDAEGFTAGTDPSPEGEENT